MDFSVVKNINLGLSFLLELCLLAAFAYWGIHTGQNLAAKILLGIGAPLLAAIFWGLFMAPRATYRVRNPLYLVIKAILFGLAVIALAVSDSPILAWVLGMALVINIVLDLLL
jgi:uncharacterized membrane protein